LNALSNFQFRVSSFGIQFSPSESYLQIVNALHFEKSVNREMKDADCSTYLSKMTNFKIPLDKKTWALLSL